MKKYIPIVLYILEHEDCAISTVLRHDIFCTEFKLISPARDLDAVLKTYSGTRMNLLTSDIVFWFLCKEDHMCWLHIKKYFKNKGEPFDEVEDALEYIRNSVK